VRVVAATNRPLARSVNEGVFREDLYYRLAVVEIELPPLRARREDIASVAEHFFERFTGRAEPLAPHILATLLTRSWPGNVRELRNFVERTVSLGTSIVANVAPADASSPLAANAPLAALDALVPTNLPLKEARVAWTEQFESVYVRSLLRKTSGNVTKAAELAGVNRRFLQRMMARLGIASSDE
jgi:DNA-binding NtrC family response regulator